MSYFIEKKRLQQAIEANPRDVASRLALADLYRSRSCFQAEERQRRKARQAKYFNPDFNYAAKLDSFGLVVTSFVGGWLIRVDDGPYEYWADPAEIQEYLEETPQEKWHACDIPLDECEPPGNVLKLLADDEEVPGNYFAVPEGWVEDTPGEQLKALGGECWLLLRPNNSPIFFSPKEAAAYRFYEKCFHFIPEEERLQVYVEFSSGGNAEFRTRRRGISL